MPAADSVDVGFARDMSIHHEQAVQMAAGYVASGVSPGAKALVIATGSSTIEIPTFKFDGKQVIGAKEGVSLKEVPKRLLVIGGDNQRIHEELIMAGGSIKEGRFSRMNVSGA